MRSFCFLLRLGKLFSEARSLPQGRGTCGMQEGGMEIQEVRKGMT
jgi:hypothetical protein